MQRIYRRRKKTQQKKAHLSAKYLVSYAIAGIMNGYEFVKAWVLSLEKGLIYATAAVCITGLLIVPVFAAANGEGEISLNPDITMSAEDAPESGEQTINARDIGLEPMAMNVEGNGEIQSNMPVEEIEEQPPEPDPSLKYGVENAEVAKLQARLMELGFMQDDAPTEYFGPATEAAVEIFQRQHELQQDGWAGEETLALIYSSDAKSYMLKEGFTGTDVDNFQEQLKDLGYLSKATGYFGSETTKAVEDFQRENGLSADGIAGEATFDLIYSSHAKPHPDVEKEDRRNANIDKMIEVAKDAVGEKYILGAEGPDAFDCSGLVYYALSEAGSNRRRMNAAGYSGVDDWEEIDKLSTSTLEKGDLVFFWNNSFSKIGHVGIYIGGGEMIDASSSNGEVVKRSVTTSYWKEHFYVARRPW